WQRTSGCKNQYLVVEAAEGTTQFDYIRRLTSESFTHNVPFWPQPDRPDAVVIFGTDIYDNLVLLEFLRQQLRNCLYLTTDLDALYWHPHYLKFNRDLIVLFSYTRLRGAAMGARAAVLEAYRREQADAARA